LEMQDVRADEGFQGPVGRRTAEANSG
jgi:hypothetical protein